MLFLLVSPSSSSIKQSLFQFNLMRMDLCSHRDQNACILRKPFPLTWVTPLCTQWGQKKSWVFMWVGKKTVQTGLCRTLGEMRLERTSNFVGGEISLRQKKRPEGMPLWTPKAGQFDTSHSTSAPPCAVLVNVFSIQNLPLLTLWV